MEALCGCIFAEVDIDANSWHAEFVRMGIDNDIVEGRLIVLIDELDHVDLEGVQFLTDIQQGAMKDHWAKCNIVVAGRPHALTNWRDLPEHGNKFVVARDWRFIEPGEFTEIEAAAYLGNADGEPRYRYVHDKLGPLVRVPRVLEYTRTLTREELENLRTAADVYEKALRHLIAKTIEEGGEELRKFGAAPGEKGKSASGNQVDHVLKLLSALAFMAHCQTRSADRPLSGDKLSLNLDQKNELVARLQGATACAPIDIDNELKFLRRFATIISNGVLEEVRSSDSLIVRFYNRSVRQFLAARWLAVHASEADASRMRHHIYFPASDFLVITNNKTGIGKLPEWMKCKGAPAILRTDTTYEFNQFLAEMPTITPTKWIRAAQYWFDPNLFGASSRPNCIWPTEMIYRSSNRMNNIAWGRSNDWWDISYDNICALPPGPERDLESPHVEPTTTITDAAESAARAVLNNFSSEFSSILTSEQDPERKRVAEEMTDERDWVSVPGGSFYMGRPEKTLRHGCPTNKVENYWEDLLKDVADGKMTAEEAANEATWSEWFSGEQGRRIRKYDVNWLRKEVFQPLWDAAQAGKEQRAAAFKAASDKIHVRWATSDETPAENPSGGPRIRDAQVPDAVSVVLAVRARAPVIVEEYLKDFEKRRGSEHSGQDEAGMKSIPADRLQSGQREEDSGPDPCGSVAGA